MRPSRIERRPPGNPLGMNRKLMAGLAAVLIVPGAGTLAAGCASDEAAQKDAEDAGRKLDDAAGKNDEKIGKAAEDAVDAVDDNDGK